MDYRLGRKARDRITGFEGTITGFCQYLSGCHQLLLVPKCGPDGEYHQGIWLDEQRVELIDAAPVRLANVHAGFDHPAPVH